jgi:DNA-binding response OmpR family regulator
MRILLVDGHPIFLIGLRCVLTSADQNVIGEANTARDAFPMIAAQAPDLVLMEIALPGMDGPSAIREICRRAPATRVLVISAHDQVNDLLDVLEAGAAGFALKSDSPELLADLGAIAGHIKVLIIRLDHVPVMDATGLVALESAIATLTKNGCVTVLTGLQPQPRALIERAGLSTRPRRLVIQPDLAAAFATARELAQDNC